MKPNEFDRRSFAKTRTEIVSGKLEENCKGGGQVGRGPGHRSRSPKARCERGAQGIAPVRDVEVMWRTVAIGARLSKRKEQFPSA